MWSCGGTSTVTFLYVPSRPRLLDPRHQTESRWPPGERPQEWQRERLACARLRSEGTVNKTHLELCSSAEWADAVRRWIIPWVLEGLEVGDDILEVGPGPGRTTEVLAEMATRLSALELDADLANSLADRLGATGVEVTEGDATQLPYEDARFSAVLSFTMLHHLPSSNDQDRLFAEAARVLRPGGVFAGTDSLDSEEWRELHIGDVCVPIDPDGLAPRLVAAGLTKVEVETTEYGIRFRGWRS